jgi:ElaB/YqjD/DUF883 family membrane-anchored ribosome-binding protein
MPAASDTARESRTAKAEASAAQFSEDVQAELARLRAQLDSLLEDRVSPALAEAAAQAQDMAGEARDQIAEQAAALARTVRDRPLASLAIAAGVGFVLARLLEPRR